MTNLIGYVAMACLLVLLIFFNFSVVHSQSHSDAFTTPVITDEMTLDPEQNQRWRSGRYPFPARPRDAWEIGFHTGNLLLSGDVNPTVPGGIGFGVHVRKSIFYTLSLRASLLHGVTSGLDSRASSGETIALDIPGFPAEASLYRNYRTTFTAGSIEGVLNIGNILFHSERNIWNIYLYGGVGGNTYNVAIDAFDDDGNPYDYSGVTGNSNTQSGRKEIREQIQAIHTGNRETEGRVKSGKWYLSESIRLQPHVTIGLGISRKINKRFNISLEHQAFFIDDDLLDGFVYRTPLDQSNQNDLPHYTHFRLAMNLGDFNNRTEPLYWLNPIVNPMTEIAGVRARPQIDMADINMEDILKLLDDEPDIHPGGITDPLRPRTEPRETPSQDRPTDFDPGRFGTPMLSEDDILTIINNKLEGIRTDWYFPMVHFGTNSFYIRPEYYPQIHSVARVLEIHPDITLVVKGHATSEGNSQYNQVLAYKRAHTVIKNLVERYGFPRNRFVLQYSEEPLPDPNEATTPEVDEVHEFNHRRVEFKIGTFGDQEMPVPSGPDAGVNEPETEFRGDRQSGY